MLVSLRSNQQTFIDLTDANQLDLTITSNLPTVQIQDNTQTPITYSPSWETTNLVLTPTVFMNSADITSSVTITWTRQDGAANPVGLMTGESVADGVLTVNTNKLSDSSSGIITYICTAVTADKSLTAVAQTSFTLVRSGATATSENAGVTFQLYAPNGYVLTNSMSSLTLQVMAYAGSTPIQLGDATYKWYSQGNNEEWGEPIKEGTESSLIVTRDDVRKYKNYKCDMSYNGNTYTSTIMVEDKSDTCEAIICVSSNANASTGNYYWVVYTLVYNQDGEVDPLLGPISMTEPETPTTDDYWYCVNSEAETVVLKKYDGTEWVDSNGGQSLFYYWNMANGAEDIPIGEPSKVKIISCNDFTTTATFKCEVVDESDGLMAMCVLNLTDASDPIVSTTAPTDVSDGQIWIKRNGDGTYLMFIWDASEEMWIPANADTQNKVYTSRPTSYSVGDLWITNSDADHGAYLQGTLLQAQTSNTAYNADDWTPTLKYDSDLEEIQETLSDLAQYVRINSKGLQIGAKTASGELSPFSSLFTSTELSFYQGSDKLLTLTNNKLLAPKVEVEESLVVDGHIMLGNLRMQIESNGSFSFVVVT